MRRSGSGTVLIANPGADLYGSDRMALETVSVLIGSGYRVVVAVAGNGPLVELLVARGAQVRVCRTPIVRKSSMRPRGMLGLLNDVRRSVVPGVRLIREVDPDLVLVNTITSPLWFLLARLLRRPCVAHVHEGEATASGLVLRALNAPLLLTRALIINSEFSRSVVVKAIPRLSQRSVVVYNAVAAVDVAPPREQLTAPVRLLYVGRLSPRTLFCGNFKLNIS